MHLTPGIQALGSHPPQPYAWPRHPGVSDPASRMGLNAYLDAKGRSEVLAKAPNCLQAVAARRLAMLPERTSVTTMRPYLILILPAGPLRGLRGMEREIKAKCLGMPCATDGQHLGSTISGPVLHFPHRWW